MFYTCFKSEPRIPDGTNQRPETELRHLDDINLYFRKLVIVLTEVIKLYNSYYLMLVVKLYIIKHYLTAAVHYY